jgi:hypothetical protein
LSNIDIRNEIMKNLYPSECRQQPMVVSFSER